MRNPGHAASGSADSCYGMIEQARECVWPARSTPLNWEPFEGSPYLCVR
jgi:hypothetical protein